MGEEREQVRQKPSDAEGRDLGGTARRARRMRIGELPGGGRPAASKVYKRDRGLSIGGYGEIRLRRFENKEDDDRSDVFDGLRQVLYVGYEFNENWVFNSELEFEDAGTSGGASTRPAISSAPSIAASRTSVASARSPIPASRSPSACAVGTSKRATT